jgi:hypothetical protein
MQSTDPSGAASHMWLASQAKEQGKEVNIHRQSLVTSAYKSYVVQASCTIPAMNMQNQRSINAHHPKVGPHMWGCMTHDGHGWADATGRWSIACEASMPCPCRCPTNHQEKIQAARTDTHALVHHDTSCMLGDMASVLGCAGCLRGCQT